MNSIGLTENFHKKTFEKIAPEKRARVFEAAISEFAAKGYNATSINIIAEKAHVSVGGLYRYFESKEALLMTVLDYGYALLEAELSYIVEIEGDLFDRIETMLRDGMVYSRKYKELTQIYLDISTEGLSHLAHKLSSKIEGITTNLYREALKEAKESGLIREDLNLEVVAFCLDNLIMAAQFSCASAYYRERLKLYVGEDFVDDDELLIAGVMDFIRNGLFNEPKSSR